MNTVLLCDDHPLLLRGLCDLLSVEPDFTIVGAATSGTEALAQIRERMPYLAVLDVTMPGFGGLDVLKAARRDRLKIRIIFLTAMMTPQQIAEALSLGISGLLLKESAPEALIDCLRQVARGETWLPPAIVARADSDWRQARRPELSALTRRESEIVEWVCRGLSNKSIAMKLGTSDGTVKVHLHNIYQKLEITNRMGLAALSFQAETR